MSLKIKQGDVYLVDFGESYNSEFGKTRPAVIVQNDFLNSILPISRYKSVLVIPFSSKDIESEYRIKIPKRDNLQKDSYIVVNWICTLDLERVQIDKGLITRLSEDELQELKEKVCKLL